MWVQAEAVAACRVPVAAMEPAPGGTPEQAAEPMAGALEAAVLVVGTFPSPDFPLPWRPPVAPPWPPPGQRCAA
jgi:hypothetical protein